jgi:hypothetical protein
LREGIDEPLGSARMPAIEVPEMLQMREENIKKYEIKATKKILK